MSLTSVVVPVQFRCRCYVFSAYFSLMTAARTPEAYIVRRTGGEYIRILPKLQFGPVCLGDVGQTGQTKVKTQEQIIWSRPGTLKRRPQEEYLRMLLTKTCRKERPELPNTNSEVRCHIF